MSLLCFLFIVKSCDSDDAAHRLTNELLTEMDRMDDKQNVFVVGATNRPDTIDSNVFRPGNELYRWLSDVKNLRMFYKLKLFS